MAEVLKDRGKGILDFIIDAINPVKPAYAPDMNYEMMRADTGFSPVLETIVAQDVMPDVMLPQIDIQADRMPMMQLPERPEYASVDLMPQQEAERRAMYNRLRGPGYQGIGRGEGTPQSASERQAIVDMVNKQTVRNQPQEAGLLSKIGGGLGSIINDPITAPYIMEILNQMRNQPNKFISQMNLQRIESARETEKANRTADYLESIGQKQAADLIRKDPSIAGSVLKEAISGGTTGFRTLEARAQAAGLEPGTEAYKQFMLRGGESALSGQFGTIPAGMQLVEVDGAVRLVPIPGGEAERKQAEEARQRQTQQELAGRAGGVVFEDIGRLEKLVSEDPILNPVLGVTGAVASFIPGTNRVDAESLAQTIRANIGFDRLQQMREASPTGGALGQVSNQELSTLQSVLGNLSLSQSQDQVLQNLDRLKKIYADILKKAQAYPNASEFGFSPASQEANTNDPLGIL